MAHSLKLDRTSCKKTRARQVSSLNCTQDKSCQTLEFADLNLILTPQYAQPELKASSLKKSRRSPSARSRTNSTSAHASTKRSLNNECLPLFACLKPDVPQLDHGMPWLLDFTVDLDLYMPAAPKTQSTSATSINYEPCDKQDVSVVTTSLDEVEAIAKTKDSQESKIVEAKPQEQKPQESQGQSSLFAADSEWDDPSRILQPQNFSLPLEASMERSTQEQSCKESNPLGDLFAGVREQVFKDIPEETVSSKSTPLETQTEESTEVVAPKKPRKASRKAKDTQSSSGQSMPLLHDIEVAAFNSASSMQYQEGDEFVDAQHILKPQSQSEYAKMMAEKANQARLLAEQQAAVATQEEVYNPLQYCQMLIDDDPSRRLNQAPSLEQATSPELSKTVIPQTELPQAELPKADTEQDQQEQAALSEEASCAPVEDASRNKLEQETELEASKVKLPSSKIPVASASNHLPYTVFTRLSKQLYVMPYQTFYTHLYLVCAVWLHPYAPARFMSEKLSQHTELFLGMTQYWMLWRLHLSSAFKSN